MRAFHHHYSIRPPKIFHFIRHKLFARINYMATTTPSPSSKRGEEQTQTFTLYFVRHGEALHNELEKQAESSALSLAISEGYDPDSPYAKNRMEEARKAILRSESMEDPPLSKLGVNQAKKAKKDLERLIEIYDLPPVEEVWVSPLQRTLQTASIVFPYTAVDIDEVPALSSETLSDRVKRDESKLEILPKIRVRKEIEERHTGLPCDRHSSLGKLTRRPTFNRFSFSALNVLSVANLFSTYSSSSSLGDEGEVAKNGMTRIQEGSNHSGGSGSVGKDISIGAFLDYMGPSEHRPDDPWDQEVVIDAIETSRHLNSDFISNESKYSEEEEDKIMLRERTKKLLTLLTETQSRSIALIGHKGYLRELERGPLGHADADLFANCEVRVYRLVLNFCMGKNDDNIDDCECVVDSTKACAGRIAFVPVLQRAEKIASSCDNCSYIN